MNKLSFMYENKFKFMFNFKIRFYIFRYVFKEKIFTLENGVTLS